MHLLTNRHFQVQFHESIFRLFPKDYTAQLDIAVQSLFTDIFTHFPVDLIYRQILSNDCYDTGSMTFPTVHYIPPFADGRHIHEIISNPLFILLTHYSLQVD